MFLEVVQLEVVQVAEVAVLQLEVVQVAEVPLVEVQVNHLSLQKNQVPQYLVVNVYT